eukprot:6209945-Pleurochrysis_carterae.AAC.3
MKICPPDQANLIITKQSGNEQSHRTLGNPHLSQARITTTRPYVMYIRSRYDVTIWVGADRLPVPRLQYNEKQFFLRIWESVEVHRANKTTTRLEYHGGGRR